VVFSWIKLFCDEENDEVVVFGGSGGGGASASGKGLSSRGFGGSVWVGASLGRVFVMASLRFGQSKEPSQLMAPVLSRGAHC
jgi:hypothetical protein